MISIEQRSDIIASIENYCNNSYTDKTKILSIEEAILELRDPLLSYNFCKLVPQANLTEHISVAYCCNDMQTVYCYLDEFKETGRLGNKELVLISDTIYSSKDYTFNLNILLLEILSDTMAKKHLEVVLQQKNIVDIEILKCTKYASLVTDIISKEELSAIDAYIRKVKIENKI